MAHGNPIEHQGIIKEIDGANIKVALVVSSACSKCHARSACNPSDHAIKIIDTYVDNSSFKVGETVKVILSLGDASLAVFYGYILPFLLIFLTLIVSIYITKNELKAGILALSTLAPYYLALYCSRKNFKKKISFQVQKI